MIHERKKEMTLKVEYSRAKRLVFEGTPSGSRDEHVPATFTFRWNLWPLRMIIYIV